MGFGFELMDVLFPIMFLLIFSIVIGIFIINAVSGLKTWNRNNNSPRLKVQAKVVSKRMNVSHHTHHNMGNEANMNHHTTSHSSYYVTFEVESGDRIEFNVPGHEYGMLVEGDSGKLNFQGTRYLSFERMF